jgi:hypothetical protein
LVFPFVVSYSVLGVVVCFSVLGVVVLFFCFECGGQCVCVIFTKVLLCYCDFAIIKPLFAQIPSENTCLTISRSTYTNAYGSLCSTLSGRRRCAHNYRKPQVAKHQER